MTDSIHDISVKRADGSSASLGDYAGKVLLIVNVASKCGLTPQYDGLEALYRDYRDRGLVVLGFPSNDFAGQEPGSDAEIQDFCRLTYGVDFPVLSKISVKGGHADPLYKALTGAWPKTLFKPDSKMAARRSAADTDVAWNFEKFLVGRDGSVVGRFGPDVPPQDRIIVDAIEAQLAA